MELGIVERVSAKPVVLFVERMVLGLKAIIDYWELVRLSLWNFGQYLMVCKRLGVVISAIWWLKVIAIQLMLNGDVNEDSTDSLVQNIAELIQREWRVIIVHQPRETNTLVDDIAKLAIAEPKVRTNFVSCPIMLHAKL